MVTVVLNRIVFVLMIASIAYAYQYHDFKWESEYRSPQLVSDNLIANCYNLKIDKAICDTIGKNNLSEDQKKNLILNGLNPDASYPDYNFIASWNGNITFTKFPPNNTISHNQGAIKDAWVKLLYLNPSVEIDNQTMLNKSGKIYSEFAFSFVVPYRTFPQDCKTIYDVKGYDYSLNTYANGNKTNLGNEKKAEFELAKTNNTFETRLDVESQYLIQHYRWFQRCSKTKRGGTVCYSVCELAFTDNNLDRLSISDTKIAYQYNFTNTVRYLVGDENNGLLDYWLEYNVSDDFASVDFRSANSSLHSEGVTYNLKAEHAPYNIISYSAERKENNSKVTGVSLLEKNQTVNNSVFSNKINLLVPSSNSCTFKIKSHFDEFTYQNFCNKNEVLPMFNISLVNRTNGSILLKTFFFENGSVIPLKNKELNFVYGSIIKKAITDDNGEAMVEIPYKNENGIVKVYFVNDLETKSAETIFFIPQQTPDLEDFLFQAFSIPLAAYIFYGFSKRLVFNV